MLATSTYQIFGVCWLGRRLKSGQKKNSCRCYTNIEILKKDGFSQLNGWHIRNHHFPSFQMSYDMSLGAAEGFKRPVSHFSVLFPHESKLRFYFSDFLNSRRRNIPRLILTVGIITKQGQIGSWGYPLLLTLSGLLRFTEAAPPAGSPGSAPARCDRAGGETGGETGGDWPGWLGPCGPVQLWCHIWRSSRHRVFSSFMPPTSTGAAVPRVLIGLPCVHVTGASVADAEF